MNNSLKQIEKILNDGLQYMNVIGDQKFIPIDKSESQKIILDMLDEYNSYVFPQ